MQLLRRALPAALIAVAAVVAACAPPPAPAPAPSHIPIGKIETVAVATGSVQLTGWALDPDTTAPIKLRFAVDGRTVGEVVADRNRPDIAASHGKGPLHGFTHTIPVALGDRVVCATALNVAKGDKHLPLGCRSVSTGSPSPAGFSDSNKFAADGYTIRIHPNASHLRSDVAWAASQVSARTKVPLTVGAAASGFDPDLSAREIVVHVGHTCGGVSVGCARTWWSTNTRLVVGSSISIVDSYTRHPLTRALLLHELSHAMGLEHFTGTFEGRRQLMHTNLHHDVTTLRSGDSNGLAEAGAVGRRLSAARSPQGTVESATPTVSGVIVTGWAADPDLRGGAANVEVTVDGVRAAGPAAARVHRPDVAGLHAEFGSHHGYSVLAPAAAGTRRVCVNAKNVSWGSDRTLGCTTVTVAGSSAAAASTVDNAAPSIDVAPVGELDHETHPVFNDPISAGRAASAPLLTPSLTPVR